MSSPTNSDPLISASTTAGGKEKACKHHVYVPPRLDEVWYQVDLPEVMYDAKKHDAGKAILSSTFSSSSFLAYLSLTP